MFFTRRIVHQPRHDKIDLSVVFQILTWICTCKGKSVDTTGESTLKLVKRPSLKKIRLKQAKI